MSERVTLVIGRTWDGRLLPDDQRTAVTLGFEADDVLRIEVDAPFAGDPPPAGPPGPTADLWEHEVVELFVAGADDAYTEVELSPHGHHLVLRLQGVRNAVATELPLAFEARVDGARWRGVARLERRFLPAVPTRCNAYRIGGDPRAFQALVAVPGDAPDFHRLDRFMPWPLGLGYADDSA